MSWDREGPTRNPRRPNQFPTDHWDGESRSPTYGPAGRLQTFEDPWSRGHQHLRPIIGARAQGLTARCNVVSPNNKALVTDGFRAILRNNSTDTLPSSSPAAWPHWGDSIYCLFDTPLLMQPIGPGLDFDTEFPSTFQIPILNLAGLRIKVTNLNGDSQGSNMLGYAYFETLVESWTPGIAWNTKPKSLFDATTDAAGTTPYFNGTNQILTGAGGGTFSGIHAFFGPNQVLDMKSNPDDQRAETFRGLFNYNGPFPTTNIGGSVIGTPTTTTLSTRACPFDYVNTSLDMTLAKAIYNSQFDTDHNFIGGYIKVAPWDSRPVVYRRIVDYAASTGLFTLDMALPYVPEVGIDAGGGSGGADIPDFSKTDRVSILLPMTGVAIHIFGSSVPVDGSTPKSFAIEMDELDDLSFELMSFDSRTGDPL